MHATATRNTHPNQLRRTLRTTLDGFAHASTAPNAVYTPGDMIELVSVATGRRESLHHAGRTYARLPSSDAFHAPLHEVDPDDLFDTFQATLDDQLDVARALGYLNQACVVGIDRHDEAWYGKEGPWLVSTNRCEGTRLAHGYLTTQRLDDPMLTLGLERLSPFRGQHAALKDLLEATLARQSVDLFLADKGFYTIQDLQLLVETGCDFVVPVPANQVPDELNAACRAEREHVAGQRFIASGLHTLDTRNGRVTVTLVFLWEPAADARDRMEGREDLFVYACQPGNVEASPEQLLAWGTGYRARWGIETGYRVLEHNRLRSTTEYRSNQVFLSYVAVLLVNLWRLVRHARMLRCPGEKLLTFPVFREWLLDGLSRSSGIG
jgi:putative transposase